MIDKDVRGVPPLHDVDIRLLRVFKTVVESKGLAAAEETLGVGRSTISKHISGLEDRLNVKLCERGRAGFAITPHGETVYGAVIELLDALDDFRSKVSSAKGFLSGAVHLWTMDNSHNEEGNPLPTAISKFKQRPGDVELFLNAASPKAVEDAVAAGLAHIGLTLANGNLPGLTYTQITTETTSIYCARTHPKFDILTQDTANESDLSGCDVVRRDYLRNDQHMDGREWRSTATSAHVETTLQLVLSGQYLGIIPDKVAKRWVFSGHIKAVAVPTSSASTHVFLVHRKKALANPAVVALIKDLKTVYQAKA